MKLHLLLSVCLSICLACCKKETPAAPAPIQPPAPALNSHFIGKFIFKADVEEETCEAGLVITSASQHTYEVIISAGSTDSQIVIDNFGGLGVNGIRATVKKEDDDYMFEVAADQPIIDQAGRNWKYDAGDVGGSLVTDEKCRNFIIQLFRAENCKYSTGIETSSLEYWQESTTNECL